MHRSHLSRKRLRGGFLHSKLGDRLLDKSLWVPTRESMARAWLVGFPITVIPMPGQSIVAVLAAYLVRGNLLLCIALQFLSTPFTAVIHLPVLYLIGEMVMGENPAEVWQQATQHWRDLLSGHTAASVYLGALVLGLIVGPLGYAIIRKTWRPTQRKRGKTDAPSKPADKP
jgi:uncharacterized protein